MQILTRLRSSLQRLIATISGAGDVRVEFETPPRPELGDLATPVCFDLARRLRRPPRSIAEEIAKTASETGVPGAARVEVAGGGYLNIFLDRNAFLSELISGATPLPVLPFTGKVIVEHTNINPNKAAHIGHLRNAVLGDTLVRCLRFLGGEVEVQNYIDDTGVQVADLVVGFREIERLDLEGVRRLALSCDEAESSGGRPFDQVCWDTYARVAPFYEEDERRLKLRAETLKALEDGRGAGAEMACFLASRMIRHHLRTMDRLGVRYDLLPRESDILRLRFWARAFERLRERGAIRLAGDGKNRGCWVMDVQGTEEGAGEDQKIIVRSIGSVTYVGKDIAYQLWKFGQLGRDFFYRPLDWADFPWSGYPVWQTCSEEGKTQHPPFGGASRVYNVIDARQSYLQRVVTQGLRALGCSSEADASIHFSYEMVALSPASIALLFPDHPLSDEDRQRPYLEMSGRRGLGVIADDLIGELERRALAEVERRHLGRPAGEMTSLARGIAMAALRYYMLRFTRNRVVAFDIEDALSFEGETGPYCQYAVVRARNIFARMREREGVGRESVAGQVPDVARLQGEEGFEHWGLLKEMSRLPEETAAAVDSLELSSLARYCHRLAQSFNTFYHRYPVLAEEDPQRKKLRLVLCDLFIKTMETGLGLLGIEAPERM
ncbi:MAG: arginine--tRNA ligase [Acidobacteria bacterium]|nr:MAG: arginine--tRNA ligase [Acidobacteriota bacterium]